MGKLFFGREQNETWWKVKKSIFFSKNFFTSSLKTGTSGLYYKSFRIVIYDRNGSAIVIFNRNDSGQYYKTVNYDPSVVIYNPSLS
jgi:hypothetical protein